MRVVLDNLNTHTPASLYKAFAPEEARRIARRLEFDFTPKHGSWLVTKGKLRSHMDEIEFSVLWRQCLNRRLASRQAVADAVGAWENARNAEGATVNWRFTTGHVRTRLGRLYPEIPA